MIMKAWFSKRNILYVLSALSVAAVAFCIIRLSQPSLNCLSIDVNPGIEFVFDDQGNVVSFRAVNYEGAQILADLDLKGMAKEKATSLVISKLVEANYIYSSYNNAVLISVLGDKDKADKIASEISAAVVAQLESNNISSSVVTQQIDKDSDLVAEANKYGITFGKMKLLRDIMNSNPSLTVEQLKDCTIGDLETIANSNGVPMQVSKSNTKHSTDPDYVGSDNWQDISPEIQKSYKDIYTDEELTMLFKPRKWVTMPNVVGLSQSEAFAKMHSLGLVPRAIYEDSKNEKFAEGICFLQDATAGVSWNTDASIFLWIQRKTPPSPTPTLYPLPYITPQSSNTPSPDISPSPSTSPSMSPSASPDVLPTPSTTPTVKPSVSPDTSPGPS